MRSKILLLILLLTLSVHAFAQKGFPFDNEIQAFKKRDSISMPKPGGILFIGSSSIRKWTDLEQRFAGKPIIKRGVGGCTLEQLVKYYTPYILFPYKPSKIFIFCGENDVAAGKPAIEVFDNFVQLWLMIKQQLPATKIYFMSLKFSPSRMKRWGQVDLANKLIRDYLKDKPDSRYLEMNEGLMTKNALGDSSLYESDLLHLNSKGYDKWQKIIGPYVK
jgi:lysophospholipase L1-like esterase